MGLGNILLDGPTNEIIQQEKILAQTYVDPPQLTRLGKQLGISESVRNPSEFITGLRELM